MTQMMRMMPKPVWILGARCLPVLFRAAPAPHPIRCTTQTEENAVKVTVRKEQDGAYSIYVPKKDLEARVVRADNAALWGGQIALDNGWTLEMPALADDTRLPITVEARRLES